MSDAPKPRSWPHAFVVACCSVFVGAIALQLAIDVLRGIAPILITSGLILVLIAAVLTLRRRKRDDESW